MSSPSSSNSILSPETEDVPKTESVEKEPTPEKEEEETPATVDPAAAAAQWQAVWSQEYNAYYFYNHTTQQTTWTNPLVPEANAQASTSQQGQEASEADAQAEGEGEGEGDGEGKVEGSSSTNQPAMSSVAAQQAAIHAAAVAQGIDPILARLDPSLVASATGSGGSAVGGSLPTFTAQFNARTGRFTTASLPSSSSSSQPVRTPAHLSEYERAKRMSSFYFDVDKWEEDLAKRGGRLMGEEGDADGAEGGAEGGKKRKRPSKKDIERFKEQKKQKKIAKTAWLRT